jgi:hypothetical protein
VIGKALPTDAEQAGAVLGLGRAERDPLGRKREIEKIDAQRLIAAS